jgi:D-serine dehydratase
MSYPTAIEKVKAAVSDGSPYCFIDEKEQHKAFLGYSKVLFKISVKTFYLSSKSKNSYL